MSRFYVPKDSIKGNNIFVGGNEAHHILDVMRLKKFDKVVTFDGTGKEYYGFIKEEDARSLIIEITDVHIVSNDKNIKITLAQAIPKKDKIDYIIEKATELGVHSIIPILTARTIPDWDEKKKVRQLERWQKIALESSKQCGRPDIPDISEVTRFEDLLKKSAVYDSRIIATVDEKAVGVKDILKNFKKGSIIFVIGPEGDFTPEEINKSRETGFKSVSLGRLVLRSDTAGPAVLAMINYEFSSR